MIKAQEWPLDEVAEAQHALAKVRQQMERRLMG
jgi:hypothetical protein